MLYDVSAAILSYFSNFYQFLLIYCLFHSKLITLFDFGIFCCSFDAKMQCFVIGVEEVIILMASETLIYT